MRVSGIFPQMSLAGSLASVEPASKQRQEPPLYGCCTCRYRSNMCIHALSCISLQWCMHMHASMKRNPHLNGSLRGSRNEGRAWPQSTHPGVGELQVDRAPGLRLSELRLRVVLIGFAGEE